MKKLGIILLSFLLILSFSFNAMAEGKSSDIGLYVAIMGGVSIPMDMDTTITDNAPGGGSITQDISLKTGWLAGAKIGYLTPFTNRILAVEFEYNHMYNDFDTGTIYNIEGVPTNFDSNVKIDAFMLNLIGRYPEGRFHPYIGAGAGYANVQIDTIKASMIGINFLNASSGSKGVFAYQILAGVDIDITKNVFVGLGYKYFAASRASYDVTLTSPLVPGADPGSIDAEYKSNNITFSIGYLF